jgi:hypothetical protein
MAQTNAPTISAHRIQPTLDNGIGNCGHWSDEFKESIPLGVSDALHEAGPIPERIQFAAAHTTAPNTRRRTLLAKNADLT